MTEKENKSSIFKDILILSIIIYYMELILRLNTKASFFNFGLLYSLILAVASASFICLISSFFKRKRKMVFIILIIFTTYLYASQLVYFDIFKTYYSVYSAVKAVKAISFLNDLIYKMFVNLHWIILISLPSIIYSWNIKKKYKYNDISWKNRFAAALIPLAIILSINYSLELEGETNKSSTSVSTQLAEPIMSVNKLGLVSTMTLDLYFNAFGFEEEEEVPEFAESEEIIHDNMEEEVRHNDNTNINNQIRYNKIEIDFDKLIDSENDEIIKNM
ncbi:MAG TPA: hypothetical protein DHM42_05740, partial [Clostridiales bacterium]|nr:hypothetical protein [Clostridiales bacterium]